LFSYYFFWFAPPDQWVIGFNKLISSLFKGFIVLEMDYKAGEKMKFAVWQRPTSKGTSLLSFKEDNWTKRKKMEEREAYQAEVTEVIPAYKKPRVDSRIVADDDDVPFN
jgi:hypothetical protein